MTDIEQQLAGNYVRLVNQCRDLQADISVKDRMIFNMAEMLKYSVDFAIQEGFDCPSPTTEKIIKDFTNQAQKQLVAEENKKAAEGSDVI